MPGLYTFKATAYCIITLLLFTLVSTAAPKDAIAQQVSRADVSVTGTDDISRAGPELSSPDAGDLRQPSELFDVRANLDIIAPEDQAVRQSDTMWPQISTGSASVVADETFVNDYVVTNTDNSGEGSLVWAINQVNSNSASRDRISFNIPGNGPHVIQPFSMLPAIESPVVLDATTQPGYSQGSPVIVLDGSESSSNSFSALILGNESGGSIVRGLSIAGWDGDAIRIVSENSIIESNFLGLLPDGTAMGNTGAGIYLFGASNNLIGGRTTARRNVISGNTTGINMFNTANGNRVEGNYIGTDPTGTQARGNRFNVQVVGSNNNMIGGNEEGAGNVISGAVMENGSGGNGVIITGLDTGFGTTASSFNQVSGNLIGTNAAGTAAVSNMRAGVLLLSNTNDNIIGGSTASHRNIIAGNGSEGIFIQDSESLPSTDNLIAGNFIGLNINGAALGNQYGILAFNHFGELRIGSADHAENIISGNETGIYALNGSGLNIQNNRIGTSPAGDTAVPNTQDGIFISSSDNNIGGTTPQQRNVISGNSRFGIYLQGSDATNNTVQGNHIGVNYAGDAALANGSHGVIILSAPENEIINNIISGNTNAGLFLSGNSTTGNVIDGNFIGLDLFGDFGIGNGAAGIDIFNAPANLFIGNVVSDNGKSSASTGISLAGSADGNVFRSNNIGTNGTGNQAIGNSGAGIIVRASSTVIGGNSPSDGNVISGNTADGIVLTTFQVNTTQTIIRNNYIGVGSDAQTPMGNGLNGIRIDGSSFNTIGGDSDSGPAYPNVIAHNGRNGIVLAIESDSNVPYSNAILGNSIFGNNWLGIDLGGSGRSINDPNDSDDGPNKLQNYPVISDVEYNDVANEFSITYTVPSSPANSAYPIRVEFFLGGNDAQGRTYIGSDDFQDTAYNTQKTVTIAPSGTIDPDVYAGIVATATDNDQNTSEFADLFRLGEATALEFVVTNTTDSGEGSLRWAIDQSNNSTETATILFNIPGSGPHIIRPQTQYVSFNRTVILDATSQPGYSPGSPVIVLDGSEAPVGASGFVFGSSAGQSEVKGFSITGFRRDNTSGGNAILFIGSGGSRVTGNMIGLLPDGTPAGNTGSGITIRLSTGNRIGGLNPADRNIISANRVGILVEGNIGSNQILGNYIGLSPDGNSGAGNDQHGISLFNSPENIISGNVISHNGQSSPTAGVEIFGNTATGNVIRSNRIGTNADGTAAIGNMGAGVSVRAFDTVIGGDNPEDGNTISGNTSQGIFILTFMADAGRTVIRNNRIGVGSDGQTPMGNTFNGIQISGSSSNVIGGISAGEGASAFSNIIAHNGRNGVALVPDQNQVNPYSNAILGNSMFGNGLRGIDLGNNGRTANDADDSDDGPNKLQNFPVIGSATYDAETNLLSVTYSVPSAPANSAYPIRVELFLGGTDNQGRTYIGSDTFAQTDYNTQKSIELTPVSQITVDAGTRITATATDNDSNTSEFADAVPVTGGDPQPVDEYVVTNTNDSGEGSLRWAVDQANTSESALIAFNIPGNGPHIIRPQTQYISFIRPVVVDATTQPGYSTGSPVIVLDGSEAPEGTNGLVFGVQAGGSTVRGFSIVGFQRQTSSPFSHGNAVVLIGSGITVAANFIGLMPDGSPMGNTGIGILIQNSSGNHIGGRTPENRNVISGNTTGIDIRLGEGGNLVEGNYIGTNPDGTEARGNRFNVQISASSGNTIGGSEEGAGNLISGALMVENSGGSGVVIVGSGPTAASGNTVAGNLIGTNAAGSEAIPNMRGGILLLFNATNNIIGGSTEAHRNIISGNDTYGIFMQASDTSPTTGNIIAGNYIGLNHNGEALPNRLGILSFGPVGENRIGHPEYPPNVISGNTAAGVQFNNSLQTAMFNGMIIQNNYIGTGPEGNSAVANTFDGIVMFSSGNLIGGTGENERNVIGGNLQHGIRIISSASSGNMIIGNYVGIGADGETGIGNRDGGITMSDAPENMIAYNVVSDNGERMNGGINIFGTDAVGNAIRANRIGTSAIGTEAVGNQGNGIEIRAFDTVIGGDSPEDGNLISGNSGHGISIFSNTQGEAGRTTIRNNFIGTKADGVSPLGNVLDGIFIEGSSSNVIGGESGQLPAFPNVIAYNGRNGIGMINYQEDWSSVSNAILGNSIFSNESLGIDLGNNGRTPNDADDSDDGPNRLQNFPVITNLDFDDVEAGFTITYSVPSAPGNSAYPLRVEFFLSDGDNQGRTYIGYDTFDEADYNTEKTIQLPLEQDVAVNYRSAVTATATDNDMNTSHFADALWAGVEIESVTVVRPITSSGTFTFNEEGQITGISITVDDLEGSGSLSVTLQAAFVENFDWDGEGELTLAENRWEIKAEDLTAGSFTVEFDLDEISGLPEFESMSELVVLKRDEPGTGTFEVLSSTITGNSLFVTITGFSEFTIGRVSQLVSIDDRNGGIPSAYALHQNYPNPFNPSTNIRFELPETVPVRLEVFTITGQRVAVLVNETRSAGHHTVSFDASLQTSGMYIYRLQAGAYNSTGKMMLIK
jgi:parallel beta-helix repeat protein